MSTQAHAKDKFIAFIDILGFSNLVETTEESGSDFSYLIELTKIVGSDKPRARTCPASKHIAADLDFKSTQISDCVVISVEVSPAGIVNLVNDCFSIVLALLSKGHLCRGYITRGNIYHVEDQFIGTGYMRAFSKERGVAFMRADLDEQGTPFIQIDDVVTDYISTDGDECVRKMCGRATKSDGTYTAIYPFEALGKIPTALIQPDFNPAHWKENVQRSLRYRHDNLATFDKAEREASDEKIKRKIRHYKHGLEEVIRRLHVKEAALDRMIATGRIPIGTIL
jgi:hypothetical protein